MMQRNNVRNMNPLLHGIAPLQRYHGSFRPCVRPRYCGPSGSSTWAPRFASGLQVPCVSLSRVHAASMPDAMSAANSFPRHLYRAGSDDPVLTPSKGLRRLISGSLSFVSSVRNRHGHKAAPFPYYLPRSLFTTAAQGVLLPSPATRQRGAHPHLTHSFLAYHFVSTSADRLSL